MPQNFQKAKELLKAGRFVDIVNGTDLSDTGLASLESAHRLLIAHALLYAGSRDLPRRIAMSINQPTADPSLRSRCEFILGIVAKRDADLELARRHLHQAVRSAEEAKESEQAAWAQLQLFRLLIEAYPKEIVRAALADARRLVTRNGEPHLTVFLHDSVAMMEGQNGNVEEGRRHLDIARSILTRYPNAWLQQLVHSNAACLAALECDVAQARQHADAAKRLSHVTGQELNIVSDLNGAHLDVMTGQFAKAFATLDGMRNAARRLARLGALEEIAKLCLALNRLDECDTALNDLLRAGAEPSVASFYSFRWAAVCEAKLLLRKHSPFAAAEKARQKAAVAAVLGDIPLSVALGFVEVEALIAQGKSAESSRKLLALSELGAATLRENVGDYYHASYQLLRLSSSRLAVTYSHRARRVWVREQNIRAFIEAEAKGGECYEIRDVRRPMVHPVDHDAIVAKLDGCTAAAMSIGAVAAAFDLAFDPELVKNEILLLAAASQCTDRIVFVAHRSEDWQTAFREEAPPLPYTAVLTSPRRGGVEVRCVPSDDAVQNQVLADLLRVVRAINELAKARHQEKPKAALWPATDMEDTDGLFVCEETRALLATSRKIAPTTVPVLITGETGTGKEILARAIHAASTRAGAVFLPFNCAAGPRDMIDAQLFGHRRGAFTGAIEHAPGVFRAAAGGTLFLDEIGEAPIDVQPKLLRVLESGEIHPIGEPQPLRVDVRVIAATNADLDAMVAAGRLREDLFYRLNIVRLHLPPLRERRVEIPVFAQHYLSRYARDLGKGDLRLAEESMEYLLLYKWPGNVRQLANEMRRLAALAETDAVLMPEHLSPEIVAACRTIPASERTLDANEIVVRLDQPLAAAAEHLERALLQYALKASGGRMEDTARRLGLSRKGLYLKRQRFGLEPPEAHARTA